MSPRKVFDRFLVDVDAAHHIKTKRLKAAGADVRWAWFHGVLPIAAKAQTRGSFTIGKARADEHDVAHQADVTVRTARKALEVARNIGMLALDPEIGCEVVHDWHDWQIKPRGDAQDPTAARRQQLHRSPELRAAVRERDGDNCRYCGCDVDFSDRRSPTGGTYDHVDPKGPNTLVNLVVACRGCNAGKSDRTPEEAGLVLLRIKSEQIRSKSPSEEVEVEGEKRNHPLTPVTGGREEEGTEGKVLRFNQRPVPDARRDLALRILDDFNAQAGTSHGPWTGRGKPSESLTRILGCLTDHPDLTFEEAHAMIGWALAHPYWQGAPDTGNVFGPRVVGRHRASAAGYRQTSAADDAEARKRAKLLGDEELSA